MNLTENKKRRKKVKQQLIPSHHSFRPHPPMLLLHKENNGKKSPNNWSQWFYKISAARTVWLKKNRRATEEMTFIILPSTLLEVRVCAFPSRQCLLFGSMNWSFLAFLVCTGYIRAFAPPIAWSFRPSGPPHRVGGPQRPLRPGRERSPSSWQKSPSADPRSRPRRRYFHISASPVRGMPTMGQSSSHTLAILQDQWEDRVNFHNTHSVQQTFLSKVPLLALIKLPETQLVHCSIFRDKVFNIEYSDSSTKLKTAFGRTKSQDDFFFWIW